MEFAECDAGTGWIYDGAIYEDARVSSAAFRGAGSGIIQSLPTLDSQLQAHFITATNWGGIILTLMGLRWESEEVHLFIKEIKAQLLDKRTHGYQN